MSDIRQCFNTPSPALLFAEIAASLAVAAVLLFPGIAKAAQAHGASDSFGEAGTGSGQLALVFPALSGNLPVKAGSGLAVDDESGDLYVADTGNHRVDEFDPAQPSEHFVRAFGADVGGAGVDVCSAGCKAGTPGTSPGELEAPTFIAVDNAPGSSHGAVYVVDSSGSQNRISKYSGEGELVTTWGSGGQLDEFEGKPFGEIDGIDVDAVGDLWVETRGGKVFEFDEAGARVERGEVSLGNQPTGIALDGAEHIYLLDGFPEGPIHRFSTAFAEVSGKVVLPDLGAVLRARRFFSGIAADRSTHDLYADQEGESIADVPPQCDPDAGLCTPSQVFGEGDLGLAAGLAVDAADSTVFAASTETQQVDVFSVILEANTKPADEVKATSATLHGRVNPEAAPVTHCRFQYGNSTAYGQELPCLNASNEEVGTVGTPITGIDEVHANAVALEGGAEQHFRLRVGNENNVFLSSEDETFSTLALASIAEVSALEVTEGSATLAANVNPKGVAQTTCELEWGATTAYGASVPCEPHELSGSGPMPVLVHLSGLDPNTTYHYRFVVADENGTTSSSDHTFIFMPMQALGSCSNETLREANASSTLPDCRAYELITPMDKNGALIGALFANNIPATFADDGNKVITPSIQCFAQSPSCVGTRLAEGEPFEFSRTSAGWTTHSLAPPATSFETNSAWRFNPNTGAILFDAPLSGGRDEWYAREADGTVSALGLLWEGEESPERSLRTLEPEPTIVTADLSHLVYESQGPLWSFDHSGSAAQGLYEYPNPNGAGPQLVGVSGGAGSTDLIGACGSVLGGRVAPYTQAYGTLSADGGTVYFEVLPCKEGTGTNTKETPVREIFARIDGDRTVAISQPNALSPAPANPSCSTAECVVNTTKPQRFRQALFEGGSSDGSRAYFTSPQQLADSATEDLNASDEAGSHCRKAAGANGCNLYLYEDPQQQPLSGAHLFDASAGDTSGLGPEVQGTLAISGDGSHAYFVAKGVLTQAPNVNGQHAVEGSENVYLYEHDAAHPLGQTTFIAALSRADEPEWGGVGYANVTPDGRYLVFRSHRGLTPDARAEGAGQIYRYDAQTGSLQRITFGQSGFNDDGNAGRADAGIAIAGRSFLQHIAPARPDPTMSEDGSKVFFESAVGLTPAALNETPVEGEPTRLAVNVYEWESEGTGSCTEARGCVWLISDGKDRAGHSKVLEGAVELLGADTTGENVYFATTDRLVPGDTDLQRDYYDARVDGGFPAGSSPAPCEGDGCRQGSTSPSPFGPLGSLTFSGPGNVPAQIGPSTPPSKPGNPRPLTKKQKLAKALKACRKKHDHKQRTACERQARKRFGSKAKKAAKRSAKSNTTHRGRR